MSGIVGHIPIMMKQMEENNQVIKKRRGRSPKPKEKPPTQGVGVQGINDTMFGADTGNIQWEVLIHIPKFQAFCIEMSKRSYENVMDWIVEYVISELEKDPAIFFKAYTDWHDAKGYWKNETVYGELR